MTIKEFIESVYQYYLHGIEETKGEFIKNFTTDLRSVIREELIKFSIWHDDEAPKSELIKRVDEFLKNNQ